MNVLFVSAEAAPFAKVGGLADVVGSLPGALRQSGVDARVLMPGYGFIDYAANSISHLFSFQQTLGEGTADVHIYTTVYDNVPFYFVQSWPYFGNEDGVYTDRDWDIPRFIYFNQLAMGIILELGQRLDWFPDVCHVNDWHTGLLPFLIEGVREIPAWSRLASILSIHNLAYQGDQAGSWLGRAGIQARFHPELIARGLTDNLLAIAIAYSDLITTVSPRYAIEIQYAYAGYGLEGLISTRAADLYGILNGIDTNAWDPATDPRLAANFDVHNFTRKRIANKHHLQKEVGLDIRDDVMLIGLTSRLVWQKGLDLAMPALRRFLVEEDVQFVALGTGMPDLEKALWRLGQDFHWRARCYIEYNASIAQHIYGGADLFLMPSHFEPCGIGQMIAMRYGALPLVRETGGLADTVENYDGGPGDRGTGFVFQWEESDAVLGTLRWAVETYRERRDAWVKMQRRAMQRDFSWGTSARQYIDLYEKVIELSRGERTDES